jgi:2-amino-4-hydroxy-6-hydroxymethyldihydropteridine diphosphokinase
MLASTKNNESPRAQVLVSMGANLGAAEQTLVAAVATLRGRGRVNELTLSSFYRTRPVGPVAQDDFVNAAFIAVTRCAPEELLEELLEVEQIHGRQREERWGPRSLDLDLLFYDARILQTPRLTLPHPEIEARGFVLAPLMDLVPEWRHPVSGRSVRESWQRWRASRSSDDAERAIQPMASPTETAAFGGLQ